MKLTATILPASMAVDIKADNMGIAFGNSVVKEYVERPAYDGPYAITPAAEAQTFSTKHLRMTDDITVAAIPDNYGLITWNGSTLTVS